MLRIIILLGILTGSLNCASYATTPKTIELTTTESIALKFNQFIDKMVTKHNFERDDLNDLLLSVIYQDDAINAMQKPAEKLPWYKYEKIFLKDNRIEQGVKFWQENKAYLDRAYKTYGVPPEIIVALIGVETFYGKNKGKYPVLDTLVSLSFFYEPRAKFFTSELEHLLLYAREENTDPRSYLGSYAGAMGYPQFISSSIRNYAVDFTNDGHRDLHNNVGDAIGSVANYLKQHGWVKGQPITTKAKIIGQKYKTLDEKINQLNPSIELTTLKPLGITTTKKYNPKLKTSLLSFEVDEYRIKNQKIDKEYWLGFNNFYVITRYNHSQNYALAVYLLSEKIKEQYNKKPSKII
jgi:membrane-bound lytic murein transglycosylase B